MSSFVSTPAALLFTQQELGGPCTEIESIISGNANDLKVVAKGNGDRVGLVIMNLATAAVTIGLTPNVIQSNGIILPASGGIMTLTVRDDFTLTSREWSAVFSGTTSLYVLEIIRFTQTQNVG